MALFANGWNAGGLEVRSAASTEGEPDEKRREHCRPNPRPNLVSSAFIYVDKRMQTEAQIEARGRGEKHGVACPAEWMAKEQAHECYEEPRQEEAGKDDLGQSLPKEVEDGTDSKE